MVKDREFKNLEVNKSRLKTINESIEIFRSLK